MRYQMGVGLFTDAVGSGIRNLNHRGKLDGRERSSAKGAGGKRGGNRGKGAAGVGAEGTGEGQDEDEARLNDQLLLCPGVVYFLKPRATGDVAMVTTKKGGLGEAILWQVSECERPTAKYDRSTSSNI